MKLRTIFSAFAIALVSSACSDFLDTSLDRNQTGETIATNKGTIWSFGNFSVSLPGNHVYIVPEELWIEVCNTVQEAVIKTISKKMKCQKAKWLSEEAL